MRMPVRPLTLAAPATPWLSAGARALGKPDAAAKYLATRKGDPASRTTGSFRLGKIGARQCTGACSR